MCTVGYPDAVGIGSSASALPLLASSSAIYAGVSVSVRGDSKFTVEKSLVRSSNPSETEGKEVARESGDAGCCVGGES